MKSVNKVFLLGNVGAAPETKATPSGQTLSTFSLATNRRWKNREGNYQEETEWHRIITWGKLAEIVRDYVKKGQPVHVEGRIQTRQWEGDDGQKRYMTEIVADNVTLLGKSGGPTTSTTTSASSSIDLTTAFALNDHLEDEPDDSLPF